MRIRTYQPINSGNLFWLSLVWLGITMIGVYRWGSVKNHSFIQNAITTTSIISISFLLFITIGLYKGYKLKDNLGKVIDKIRFPDSVDLSTLPESSHSAEVEDGCLGILFSIFLWIIWAIVFSIALWVVGNVLVGIMALLVAMVYWIFFRAMRMVFKNVKQCKGKLWKSFQVGFFYTYLYSGWLYGVLLLSYYFKH
ncbi:hypothetical protein GXP67_16070 [Rhodocytophaga rosea]|uniref:Uncharacterized protein n=1 Tax=Rhodocytophaga rosea TaxID=2704465 RepID=A0A6C0GJ41_9BACT|nr:hypothetical protein [Rhodocytophaga rosea]QHT68048.1 hypothetical protein GXP67_16070 [Rhodocytophaga rosea]